MLFVCGGRNLEGESVLLPGERQPKRIVAADFLFIPGHEVADVRAAQRVKAERVAEPRDVFGVVDVAVHVEIGILRRAIEDLRRFARLVEGRRKAPEVTAWIVPGSKAVEAAAKAEGLDRILAAAGFELRQPGCSACLAMNADKIPAGKYCVSTSNRNFEGRQGPGARTLLSGVAVAAAAAVSGRIADPRELFGFPPND